jgi:hypothetical protein
LARKLFRKLNYDARIPLDDLESCLKIGHFLDNEQEKARAGAMVQHRKVRAWLAEDISSRSLLVNGHSDLAVAEGPSPLSLVGAELVAISERIEPAFVVKYFCGLHAPSFDRSPESSAVGMISSLLGQLLSQMLSRELEVDVSFLKKTDFKDVEGQRLQTLCFVFRKLVEQLPSKSLLICVLDEVSSYEISSLNDDTDAVMRRLTRLVDTPTKTVIKMLVACRGRALNFQQYFHPDDILDLDEDPEPDDSAMWKIKHLNSGT